MAEQQLDLIKKQNRGGARKGAGAKAKRFLGGDSAKSSKPMRVPLMYADAVKQLIAALDAASAADTAQSDAVKIDMHITPDRADLADLGGGVIELIASIKRLV